MSTNVKGGRLSEDMKREIISIISGMKDPRLNGFLTVMRVECTSDLSNAKVYVSMMGEGSGTAKAVEALTHAAGYVRTEISKRMHIRKAPEFAFYEDNTSQYAAHINELLKGLEKE